MKICFKLIKNLQNDIFNKRKSLTGKNVSEQKLIIVLHEPHNLVKLINE